MILRNLYITLFLTSALHSWCQIGPEQRTIGRTNFFLSLASGISCNYSKTRNISELTTNPFSFATKSYKGLTYIVGLEASRKSLFCGARIKLLRIGDYMTFEGDGDIINAPFSAYCSTYNRSIFASVYVGKNLFFKRIVFKPSIGLSKLLNPNPYSSFGAMLITSNDTMFIQKKTTSSSNLNFQVDVNLGLAFPFQIKKTQIIISYNCSYSFGLSKMYDTSISYYTQNTHYSFINTNNGSHLIHSVMLYFPLGTSKLINVQR